MGSSSVRGRLGLVDLVEDTTVAEVLRLRLLPAAEQRIVDRDQFKFGKVCESPPDRPLSGWTDDSGSWR